MKKTTQLTILTVTTLLLTAQSVESKMFFHDAIFKAIYNTEVIYGSSNSMDDRVCAVIGNKATFGKMNKDGKSASLGGRKIKILYSETSNYASFSGGLRLSKEWWNRPQSKKCLNYTSYGQCFAKAVTPYYMNDPNEKYIFTDSGEYTSNSRASGVFKTRTKVFVEAGIDNNDRTRNGVKSEWAYFSLSPKEISFDSEKRAKFLISTNNFICDGASSTFRDSKK